MVHGNLPLNTIARELDKDYDADGEIASSGEIHEPTLKALNALSFYNTKAPKSLGTEWIDNAFSPLLDPTLSPQDRMRTIVEHISDQIAKTCREHSIESIYVTGGGVHNSFLIEKIRQKTQIKLVIPDSSEVEFKEAIIFGLLGALYLEGRTNTLSSVTGATHDVIGGVLHLP